MIDWICCLTSNKLTLFFIIDLIAIYISLTVQKDLSRTEKHTPICQVPALGCHMRWSLQTYAEKD